MALTPGTRLGPYEIVSPIGAGGMGEVYKAADTRLDRVIAIKRGDPPRFGAPRRVHPGPLEFPASRSIDFDPSGERILVAPSLAVLGDLAVLVNWQSMIEQR